MEREVFSLLSKPLREEIDNLGWKKATEIQEIAVPVILKKEDVLLIAPTGTGKTEAAVFPVFELFLQERCNAVLQGISILYITPLRALNRDIFGRLIEIGERLDINVQVRHGDTTQHTRRKQALKPPNMLITTPETLQAILPGNRMQQHLKEVRWVIIDEIHELATDKRGVQLTVCLERLRQIAGRDFQRVGLSATIGSPELIAQFLRGDGRSARILRTGEFKDIEVSVESPTTKRDDERIASNVMISAGSVRRIQRLFEIIEAHKSTLVFTNTREHAEALSSRMLALRPELEIGVHHGSLSKDMRVETEGKLKKGELRAVICTSSLELGIDVGDVEFVVQYMSPKQVTRLLQRIGRSGHVIGATSKGCIIASWPDDILESAVISKFALEGLLETPKIHENALDVLAQQVAGIALDHGRIRLDDAFRIVTRAWPYRNLSLEEFTSVIWQLEKRKLVWFDGDVIGKRYPQLFRYYYENLSMIADVKHYDVIEFLNRRKIGTLDQEFIAKNGKAGQEFIMHGQNWKILGVDDEKGVVQIEPVHQSFGSIPSWEGEMIPVSYEVAQKAGRIRGEIEAQLVKGLDSSEVFSGYSIDKEAAEKIVDIVKRQIDEKYPVPTDKKILIESFENYAIIHSCFGDLVNETLGKALASMLSSRVGINIGTQADPYRIALIFPTYVNSEAIKKELANIRPEDLDIIIVNTMAETSLLAWRLWNVAKRFGLVSRNAEFKLSHGRMMVKVLQGTPVYKEALREIYVEKLDLEYAKKILAMIQSGEIEVETAHRHSEYSAFALPILDRIAPHDVLRPIIPTKSIIEVIKDRLESEDMKLICIFKGDYEGVRKVRSLPKDIKCPKCGSTLIAATYKNDLNLINIVRKKVKKTKLSSEEEKAWQTAWKNASIVQNYGKKAITAMAARGVGPTNAVRILHTYHRTEDDFYLDIIRAERDYARTRMFWDK
ncbi:MAG: ATP-dependent helicase Lhr and Lhr-like helicase [Thermoproteota archaeon]|nr:ATP-dependent helicase Lhr and Lhr-like helicase [Thermoproteota archaeon]